MMKCFVSKFIISPDIFTEKHLVQQVKPWEKAIQKTKHISEDFGRSLKRSKTRSWNAIQEKASIYK